LNDQKKILINLIRMLKSLFLNKKHMIEVLEQIQ
jgi:hypothetical protein